MFWLFEELDVLYEIVCYVCDLKMMFVLVELCVIYLFGKLFVVIDDGCMFVELGVIIEYLVECYGNGCFVLLFGLFEWYDYMYWLYYVEGLVMLLLLFKFVVLWIVYVLMLFFVWLIVCKIVVML